MIYLILSGLIFVVMNLQFGAMAVQMLKLQSHRIYLAAMAFSGAVLGGILALWVCSRGSAAVVGIASCAWIFVPAVYTCRKAKDEEPLSRRMFLVFGVGAWAASLVLGMFVYHFWTGADMLEGMEAVDFFLFSVFVSICFFLITWVLAALWKKRESGQASVYLWIYLVFPISQFIAFWAVLQDVRETHVLNIFYMLGLLSGAVSAFILFYVIFEQSKKAKTEKRLRELRYMQELESAHYDNIEKE